MEKMKAGNLGGIQRHNQRETENHSNKDIDIERSHLNYDLVNSEGVNYQKKIHGIINEQRVSTRAIRKDAVLVDEWIITSDKLFFESIGDSKKFFEDSFAYFSERCGAQNMAYATVHLDETTPHMHLGIVPVQEGCLSSKQVFSRQTLREIQDELPNYLQERGHDLERGIKGSQQKHLTVQEYKENQNKIAEYKGILTGLEARKEDLLNQSMESIESDYELSEKIKQKRIELAENSYEIKKDLDLPKKLYPEEIKTKREGFRTVEHKTGRILVPSEDLAKMTEALSYVEHFRVNYMQLDKKNEKLEKENKAQQQEIIKLSRQNESLVQRYKQLAGRFSNFLEESGKRCQERWEDGRTKFNEIVGYAKEKTTTINVFDKPEAKKDFNTIVAPHCEKNSAAADQVQQELKQKQIERRKTRAIDWDS